MISLFQILSTMQFSYLDSFQPGIYLFPDSLPFDHAVILLRIPFFLNRYSSYQDSIKFLSTMHFHYPSNRNSLKQSLLLQPFSSHLQLPFTYEFLLVRFLSTMRVSYPATFYRAFFFIRLPFSYLFILSHCFSTGFFKLCILLLYFSLWTCICPSLRIFIYFILVISFSVLQFLSG